MCVLRVVVVGLCLCCGGVLFFVFVSKLCLCVWLDKSRATHTFRARRERVREQ